MSGTSTTPAGRSVAPAAWVHRYGRRLADGSAAREPARGRARAGRAPGLRIGLASFELQIGIFYDFLCSVLRLNAISGLYNYLRASPTAVSRRARPPRAGFLLPAHALAGRAGGAAPGDGGLLRRGGAAGRRVARHLRAGARARSHRRFVPPFIHVIPELLRDSVPLHLKQQRDGTLGGRWGCRRSSCSPRPRTTSRPWR